MYTICMVHHILWWLVWKFLGIVPNPWLYLCIRSYDTYFTVLSTWNPPVTIFITMSYCNQELILILLLVINFTAWVCHHVVISIWHFFSYYYSYNYLVKMNSLSILHEENWFLLLSWIRESFIGILPGFICTLSMSNISTVPLLWLFFSILTWYLVLWLCPRKYHGMKSLLGCIIVSIGHFLNASH